MAVLSGGGYSSCIAPSHLNLYPTPGPIPYLPQVDRHTCKTLPFTNFVCGRLKIVKRFVPEDDDEVGSAPARRVVARLVGVELPALLTPSLHRLTPNHLELRVVQQPSVHKRHQRPVTIETESKTLSTTCNHRNRVTNVINDL